MFSDIAQGQRTASYVGQDTQFIGWEIKCQQISFSHLNGVKNIARIKLLPKFCAFTVASTAVCCMTRVYLWANS